MRDLPPDERPREKLMRHGAEVLSTSELLAVVLGSGTEGQSALELARRLLEEAGGTLYGLASLPAGDLVRWRGMGPAKVARLRATVELARRMWAEQRGPRPVVRNAGDLAAVVIPKLRYLDREHLLVVMLDASNRVVGMETVSVGDLTSSIAHPREVFKPCIRRNAAAVALAHNHPSGDPVPSEDDLAITERLIAAGRLLGIEVLDHVILSDDGYISLRQAGFGWEKGE
ncbi:MAG: DNA repair protein RadC [Bacillota bacterium]|nr:DNA repair protein RadC [Bacillota bacterium]MDI7250209.1 DNA repair protein RadC [Bacillota bacterium]